MPSYGKTQIPAGVKKACGYPPVGERKMMSKNTNIKTSLKIDNVPYKGNAVLNANR